MKRVGIALLVLLVAVPLALLLGGGAVLDSAPVRARIVAAAERATGHSVRLDGPLRLAWSLTPRLEANDVALLNPPGFSRASLATVARITADVALLPLLSGHIEIRNLVLDRPNVLLERNAAGLGNWQTPVVASTPAPAARPGARAEVVLDHVALHQATIAWRGLPPLTVPELDAAPSGGPVSGTAELRGVTFAIKGQYLPGAASNVTAVGGGLALAASGQPGGDVALEVLAPDLAAVRTLAGRALPPLRDVHASLGVGPRGLVAFHLAAGASDLGVFAPGLNLAHLDMTAAAFDRPVRLVANGMFRSLPFAAAVNVGSLAELTGNGPVQLQALLTADGGSVSAQGSMTGRSLAGVQATVNGTVPDLRRTGALAGAALPALTGVTLKARVSPLPSGHGVSVRGLTLLSQQGDVAGDLALESTNVPSLRGSLVSHRLDLDLSSAGPPRTIAPSVPPATPAAQAVPPAQTVPPPQSLPFGILRQADADLHWEVDALTFHGAVYHAVAATLLLQGGVLRLDPITAIAPGGPARGQILADATAQPPTAAVMLRAPTLDAAPVAAALGEPGALTGTLDLDLRLHAAGTTWPAMQRTLEGHAGVALTNGKVANEALSTLFGAALRAAKLPVEADGHSDVQCFAVRADAAAGQVTIPVLALDSTRLRLSGNGTIDLVDQTLDLHLRPTLRLGRTAVEIPVHLTGPLDAPHPAVERGVIAAGRFGISIGAPSRDPCPAALAAVKAAP